MLTVAQATAGLDREALAAALQASDVIAYYLCEFENFDSAGTTCAELIESRNADRFGLSFDGYDKLGELSPALRRAADAITLAAKRDHAATHGGIRDRLFVPDEPTLNPPWPTEEELAKADEEGRGTWSL